MGLGIGIGISPILREGVGAFGFPRIAGLGDSITDNNTAATVYYSIGHIAQAQAYSGWNFDFTDALNFGVSGNTSAQILARVGDVVAAAADRCILLAGTNDLPVETPAATVIANIADTVAALRAANIIVDLIPILPRSLNMTSTRYQLRKDINVGILAMAASGVNIVRADLAILDTGSSDEAPLSGTTSDGLHPSTYGAMLVGKAISDFYALQGGYFRRPVLDGTLISLNPELAGTSGSKGTGATGNVATSCTVARNSGSTLLAACSKTPDDMGQIIDLSSPGGGSTSETVRLLLSANISMTAFTTADWFQLECEVECEDLVGIRAIYAVGVTSGSGVKTGLQNSGVAADRVVPDFRQRIRSPRFQLTTPASEVFNWNVFAMADCSGVVSGRMTVRQPRLCHVA